MPKITDLKRFLPYFAIALVAFVVLLGSWGSMQMGDYSIDVLNGLLIKIGRVPYRDIYLYATPFTAYLSAFVQMVFYANPIHALNILGVLNLFVAMALLWSLGDKLELGFWKKIVGISVTFGVQMYSFINFTHHAFDLTLSIAYIWFLVLHLNSRRVIHLIALSLVSVLVFFTTQHIGFALICFAPGIFLLSYILDRKRSSLKDLFGVIGLEIMMLLVGFVLLFSAGGVPKDRMLSSIFCGSFSTYSAHYGHFNVWLDPLRNVEHFVRKKTGTLPKADQAIEVRSFGATVSDDQLSGLIRLIVKRAALLTSVEALVLMTLMTLLFVSVFFAFWREIARHGTIADELKILLFLLLIFFAESIMVFQLEFSMMGPIILFAFKHLGFARKCVGKLVLGSVGAVAMVMLTVSFGLLYARAATKVEFTAGPSGEKVWVSSLVYNGLVGSLYDLKNDIKSAGQNVLMYARASDMYYITNTLPPGTASTLAYSHPPEVFEETAQKAKNVPYIVVYHPPFPGEDELEFSMQFMRPVLDKFFKLQREDVYFSVYKHL